MINRLFGMTIVAFICALSITELSAQIKDESDKVIVIEKVINKNGQVSTEKVILKGKEAEDYLKESEDLKDIDVTIDHEDDNAGLMQKQIKIKVLDKDGDEKDLEWNGKGPMPAEIEKLLKQEGLKEINLNSPSKKTVKVITKKDGQSKVEEFHMDGDQLPNEVNEILKSNDINLDEFSKTIQLDDSKGHKIMKIKTDGVDIEEVLDLEWDGEELPADVLQILQQEDIDLEEIVGADGSKEIKIIAKVKEPTQRKAQLGINIRPDILGVAVANVLPNSSAYDAGLEIGDIITKLDDTTIRTPKQLVELVAGLEPGTKLNVEFNRGDQKKKVEITLKERVDPFPFKTWKQVMKSDK